MNLVGRPTKGSDLDLLSALRTSPRAMFLLRFAAAFSRRIRLIGPARAIGDVEKWVIWNGRLGVRERRSEDTVKDPNDEVRDLKVDIEGNAMSILLCAGCPRSKVSEVDSENLWKRFYVNPRPQKSYYDIEQDEPYSMLPAKQSVVGR